MNAALQKDLRNALSHQDYMYVHDNEHVKSITWHYADKYHTWKLHDLETSTKKINTVYYLIGKVIDDDLCS